jgi:MFS transporter, FSR family, fosmidomycin resistance protein
MPGLVRLVAGMFFSLPFGSSSLDAAALGLIADAAGIEAIYRMTPLLLGLLTAFLSRRPGARGRIERSRSETVLVRILLMGCRSD